MDSDNSDDESLMPAPRGGAAASTLSAKEKQKYEQTIAGLQAQLAQADPAAVEAPVAAAAGGMPDANALEMLRRSQAQLRSTLLESNKAAEARAHMTPLSPVRGNANDGAGAAGAADPAAAAMVGELQQKVTVLQQQVAALEAEKVSITQSRDKETQELAGKLQVKTLPFACISTAFFS